MKSLKKALCLFAGLALAAAAVSPVQAAFRWPVRIGYGVSAVKWLSDYNPNLRDTDYDTPVYVMQGKKPGARGLLYAGEHAREIAGVLSAEILLERGQAEEGTLFVIPCLNSAGMSVPDELGQVPHTIPLKTRNGNRWIHYGDRRIPLRPGEKDPEQYVHPSGFVIKDGSEWRNINRNYPGVADGTPAQQVAFGVMELIRRENIQCSYDVHESTAPEEVFDPRDGKTHRGGTLSYMIVTHPKYLDHVIEMILSLEDRGIKMKPEASIPGFRGISHYEIATGTNCVPILSETPNPCQNAHSYQADPLHDKLHPIEERVGINMELFGAWFEMVESITGKPLTVKGLPSNEEIRRDGVGAWLE